MAKKDTKSNKKEIKKENKNKKSFFKGLKAELKKVNWPTPKQLVNNTVAVITIVLITALIVFVLDFTFEAINKNGIDKIKESVHSLNASENTTNETNTENADSTNEAQSNENNSESNTTNNVEETNTANNTENTAE
ncbi:MAG: preprotein translocase subunit SecE [Clostridia bacterium]|nr:preprotein translocase subunit SecE [Clostridium sp.]